ncbi:MAG: hypothetical protein EU550_00210 [Promethearchaeota archaeon]|nr:MAG: hypothetical protein EU550_00210 [Candidatus Lokiarchaeota archaeon]
MDKNAKEFFLLFKFYKLIVISLLINSLFIPFVLIARYNILINLGYNFVALIYGTWEAVPFLLISKRFFKKQKKIRAGIFFLEIGTFLNSSNCIFLYSLLYVQSFDTSIRQQEMIYFLGFYFYPIISILLIIIALTFFIENKRKDFKKVIADYKTQINLRKLEQEMRRKSLENAFIDIDLLNSLNSRDKKVNKEDFLKSLNKERKILDTLFDSGNYDEILNKFREIYTISKYLECKDDLEWLNRKIKLFQNISIKKTILELAIKFDRLELSEIAEKSIFKNESLIENVIKDMINNKEIYADYYESTNSLLFDKETNMEEIDKLMHTFQKWEKSTEKKLF